MGNTVSELECKNKEELKEKLSIYGFVFISDILIDEDVKKTIDMTWDYFEYSTSKDDGDTRIDRNNPKTWDELSVFLPNKEFEYNYCNVGHSSVMWKLRETDKILNIFGCLWCQAIRDMLVSFQGFCFKPGKFEDYKVKNEYTTLEDLNTTEFKNFQGFYSATEINGNFTILSGSHKKRKDFIKLYKPTENMTNEHIDFFKSICETKHLFIPSNSLLIWDTRLIYNFYPSTKNMTCGHYLSYYPRHHINRDQLVKRNDLFRMLKTTDHDFDDPYVYSDNPPGLTSNLDDMFLKIPRPNISDLCRRLVGIN